MVHTNYTITEDGVITGEDKVIMCPECCSDVKLDTELPGIGDGKGQDFDPKNDGEKSGDHGDDWKKDGDIGGGD